MTITIYVRPDETISQALSRALLEYSPPVMLPRGLRIEGYPPLRKTYFVDRRKTGIPFMPRGEP